MGKTRRNARRGHSGGGYLTDPQYFNPSAMSPTTGILGGGAPLSTAPTPSMIRPVLYSTYSGGGRRTRRGGQRGGFSPSVMGGFIPNAQAAIVPAALYMVYHTFVPKGARGKTMLRNMSRKVSSMFKKSARK